MAFPAVADLFKGSIDEGLKKLVQPAAIVPAAVFVLLNLAVIYPALLDAGVSWATAFKGLEDTLKVVLISASILVLGYVLLNLNGSMLRLATGELIAETPIGTWLTDREKKRIQRFKDKVRPEKDGEPKSLSIKTEDTKLPPPEKAAPTRLGNVLAGASDSLVKRYGFDLGATWVHLETLLAKDQKEVATALDDERVPMEVLVSLSVVVVVFGVEAALVSLIADQPTGALALVVAVPAAYGLYRAACARAGSYVDLVKAAVDLYRSDLGTKLGILKTDDIETEQAEWKKIADWFLYDVSPLKPSDATASLVVTTSAPDNLTVKALPTRRTDPVRTTMSTKDVVEAVWIDRYGFLVTAKLPDECCKDLASTQMVLSAGSAWSWDGAPPVEVLVGGVAGNVLPLPGSTGGDSLLVRLELNGTASVDVLVDYSRILRLKIVDVGSPPPGEAIAAAFETFPKLGDRDISIKLTNDSGSPRDVRFDLRCSWAGEVAPLFTLDGATVSPGPRANDVWSVNRTVPAGNSTLKIVIPEKGPTRKGKD
jgi:hypothetical protein